MSSGDYRRSQSAFSLGTQAAVKITPNRHSLDNKFPVLGFTVQTGGLPYFEVLLTTDRALFAPANASQRNATNFYVSRQDSGLIHISGTDAIYLVPPVILRAFAQAQPRPGAIYYTLIAYRDAEGGGPVFAHGPESLPTNAPSVTLASDFTGQTLATVLGIPVEHLKPVYAATPLHETATAQREAGYGTGYAFTDSLSPDEASDRAEGEDGYSLAYQDEGAGTDFAAQAYGDDDFDFFAGKEVFSDSYAAEPSAYQAPKVNGYVGTTFGGESDFAYSDGYEDNYGPVRRATARAQESAFPTGAPEPAPLSDEEQPYGEDFSDDEFSYGQDRAALELARPEEEDRCDDSASFAYDEEGERYDASYSYGAATEEDAHPEYLDDESGAYEMEGSAPESYESSYASDAYDDEYGDEYDNEQALSFEALDVPAAARVSLTIDNKKRIIERIAQFESGRERYAAINADGEFEGRFGHDHPAYQKYHIGLSYGLIQFTQDSGLLGRLLTMMQQRDGQTFTQIFGSDAAQLITVATATGPPSSKSPNGRSARVQPVGSADLWREPWLARFRRAGQHVPFQAAQNQLAAETFLDPVLQFAGWLGLDTERALALVVDRAIQMGRGGGTNWIISVLGPIQTAALRGQALAALGHSDVRAFQSATPGLRVDRDFGPQTHAAMVGALRGLGARSPIPIPTREQMMDAMVRAAAARRWAHRVSELRQTGDLNDTPLQF